MPATVVGDRTRPEAVRVSFVSRRANLAVRPSESFGTALTRIAGPAVAALASAAHVCIASHRTGVPVAVSLASTSSEAVRVLFVAVGAHGAVPGSVEVARAVLAPRAAVRVPARADARRIQPGNG